MIQGRRQFLTGAAALALVPGRARAQGRLNIVATTAMIADVAQAVGGDLVTVRALMGPGVDPHGYRQTRTDITALVRADLVLWNGLALEAQMQDFLRDLARDRPVLAVAETLPQDLLIAAADHPGRFDPHLWMDTALWARVVVAIRDRLSAMRPGDAAQFGANAAACLGQMAALGDYAAGVLETVRPSSRVLVSAHDAFAYFGAAHGYEVIGIQGLSTESEAGLRRIGELVDLLVARDIRAVFVETSVSDRNIRALIEGAAAAGHQVRIGGALYSDAMGPPGTYEGTYPGMIDHNVTVIARALGGQAPAGGMQGRLDPRTTA